MGARRLSLLRQGLKAQFLGARNGAAEQLAEEVVPERETCPQRLKPYSQQCTYRSGEPLRHPKSSATSTFSASCEAASLQNNVKVPGGGRMWNPTLQETKS
jgi:hypothetical protein